MIKTIQKSLLTILSLSVVFSSTLLGVDNQSFEKLKVFTDIKGTVTGHKLITKNVDLYLVKGRDGTGRPFEIIVDKDGNYVILSSKVFDVKNNKAITIPIDMTPLKGQEAFTYGSGKKHYYVFTDPQCPYCKRFESVWPKLAKDVTLHVYFYNLSSHTQADAMTRWVLNGKTDQEKADRLFKVSNGDSTYKTANFSEVEKTTYNKLIAKHRNLGDTLGIQGVPSVLDANGNVIPWPSLKP